MDYSIYPYGVLRNSSRVFSCVSLCCSRTRGNITGFSDHSRLRLRKWLLFKYIPNTEMWGVTLTIPAQPDISFAVSSFSIAVHRLRVYFLRRFPLSGFVWRVELQRNKMPHLHLVVFTGLHDVQSLFVKLWSDIVLPLFDVGSLDSFLRHGVCAVKLDGNIRAIRYLCDHGSKRKQAQLGWHGRQWGVVGRDYFVDRSHLQFTLDNRQDVLFRRFLRRLTSFSVRSDCVFGSRLVRRKGVNSVAYVSGDAVQRWLEYYDLPF